MKIKILIYEIISFIFFINACSWLLPFYNYFGYTKYIIFTFSNITSTILGLATFTTKAMCMFNISKTKKVLLIIAQLAVYFILYVIWFIIYFILYGDIYFNL